MVKKVDGTYRMAIDFRSLNVVTLFHAGPTYTIEESPHRFTGAKYLSELDRTCQCRSSIYQTHARSSLDLVEFIMAIFTSAWAEHVTSLTQDLGGCDYTT